MDTQLITVDEIIVRFTTGKLADEDDATLHTAVRILEYAEQHYFDGYDYSGKSAIELGHARERRHYYTKVVNAILKLMLDRYGCND